MQEAPKEMKVTETPVQGAYVLEPDRHEDQRGFFQELFNRDRYKVIAGPVAQINWSFSCRNVVRGIHKVPFFKLCTCLSGELWDVVVDLRPNSPTYKKWFGVWLDPGTPKQLYVPPDCGHGFFAATDNTLFVYAQGGVYDPALESSVHFQDPTLGVKWPAADYIVSEKDALASFLNS